MCKYKHFYLFRQTYFKFNIPLNINIFRYSIFKIKDYLCFHIYIYRYKHICIYLYIKIKTYIPTQK